MSRPTIKELYNKLEASTEGLGGDADHMVCDILTTIKEIPGVEEAVLRAALKDNYHLRHFGPETVGDIAFQYLWDTCLNPEDVR